MADGINKYETVDLASFIGLMASIDPTDENFPLNAATTLQNFDVDEGVLRSRKGMRRINDLAKGNTITFLLSYSNRNNIDYLVYGVQNTKEGLETPDGTVSVEANAGLRKPLVRSFSIGETYVWDMKVRNDYIYVMVYNTTSNTASVKQYTKKGVLVDTHPFTDNENHYTFEVDTAGSLYVFTQVAGTEDLVQKFTFGNVTPVASVALATGTGANAYSMAVDDVYLYVGYNDGTNAKVDRFTYSLVLDSNRYSVVSSDRIDSISFSRNGTIFVTRRTASGLTRGLYYYDGATWDQLTGEFINQPSRVSCQHDDVYVALIDDTVNGASQAMLYRYDVHMSYKERMGNVFLSAATKLKPWDISTRAAGEIADIDSGRVILDVDSEYIYIVDAIEDSNLALGIFTVIKRFRR